MSSQSILRFGPHGALVGVLTAPSSGPGESAVILLNAGLIHHVGPNRAYVRLAHALAGRGIASLRFDFSGVGDSPARADNLPIFEMVVVEPREAMEALGRLGVRRFILIGICSGAYSALKVAKVDERVVGAGLVNIQDVSGPDSAASNASWSRRYWGRSLFRPRAWMNLVTGRVDYRRLVTTLARQLVRLPGPRGDALAAARAELAELAGARRVKLLFVVSGDDVSRDYVGLLLEGCQGDARRAVAVVTLDEADHLFTRRIDQDRFIEALLAWVTQCLPPARNV